MEVAFSMENEIQVGDVNWSIITEGAHFYEPDEIQGSEERCAECRQLLRLPTRKLKENLFTEFARKVADVSKKIDDIPGEKGLTMNQLRNFYDVIKTTQDRLMQVHNLQKREDEFRLEKPRLKLLFSKVVNAQRRGNIPKVFAKFMDECLEIVTKEDAKYHDFEAFVLTFEAVAGYFGKDE